MRPVRLVTLTLCAILSLGVSSYGQHSYTPDDIAAGGQLYRTNCLTCHGPNGDAVTNAPVMTGKFRRGNSDEELTKIIRSGIPGTSMAAQPALTEAQAGTIVGFLRSVVSATPATTSSGTTLPAGDATRGKAVFNGKGNCLSCHQVNGTGSQFGPDLSAVGNPAIGRGAGGGAGGNRGAAPTTPATATLPAVPAGANVAQLQESLIDPNKTVSSTNRYIQFTLKDGATHIGRLLNQDTYAVQILTSDERLQSISRSNIRSILFTSPMPSYRDRLTNQELADVISYLVTLKGQSN